MKYSNYTWNTGHTMRHDTDVNLDPAIVPLVRELLEAREGPVPGAPVRYRLDAERDMAALTVTGRAPVWTTLFYVTEDGAARAVELAASMPADRSPELPAALSAPGLLTIILPTACFAGVDGPDLAMLADFAKTMFSVWAIEETNRT